MNSAPYHKCFETLANELRVRIIRELQEKPLSVQELAEQLGAEQSRVSHALQMLRTCNYVQVDVKGKEHIYVLAKGTGRGIELAQSPLHALAFADQHFAHACRGECNKIKAEK